MSHKTAAIPQVSQQPPQVDFIDNYLLGFHPGFEHPSVKYDPSLKKYDVGPSYMATESTQKQLIPARPLNPPLESMKFWTYIFSDSMEKLKSNYDAPEGSPYSGYGIRDMENWEGVRNQLLKAKEV